MNYRREKSMKHFIVEITYTAPFEQLSETVPEHRAFLQTGYDSGWLLCSGPQVPKTGGIVVARAPSLKEIESFFTNDPYQQKGMEHTGSVNLNRSSVNPFSRIGSINRKRTPDSHDASEETGVTQAAGDHCTSGNLTSWLLPPAF
jgi:uncharacterized protein YciI